jgi:hypothetical protein
VLDYTHVKPGGGDESHQALVPCSRGLLEIVKKMVQAENMLRTCRVDEAGRLWTVGGLGASTMVEMRS